MPFELVIANLKRIAASVDLPVTLDIEGGYGRFVSEISENVHTVESGAIGINLEDQIPGGAGLPDCKIRIASGSCASSVPCPSILC